MPLYDYDCMACGRRIEVVHGVHAPGPTHCPNCGEGPLKKAISAPAVHFKGSGWAKRDRRATVAPGTSQATSEAATASGEDAGRGKPAERASEGATDSGPEKPAEKPAAPARTSGGSTATRTD